MENRLLLSFLLVILFLQLRLTASDDVSTVKSEVRIANLLPYLVHLPLVDPYLPKDFILGHKKDDPYFTQGYYWGNAKTVQDYFEDPSSLNSCIIRAQISTNVTQIGLDRFSNDGKINDLSVAGFTEILVNKGKWGIFPYREVHAKGPKGRHYYQLWIGLNEVNGTTLYFQLLYPEYINEPTQNQKKVWKDFIKKTSFLSLHDLMVFHKRNKPKEKNDKLKLSVEKRLIDNKFVITIESEQPVEIDICKVKECNLLTGAIKLPYVELHVIISENGVVKSDVLQAAYTPVKEFTFYPCMLYPKALESHPEHFLVLKK